MTKLSMNFNEYQKQSRKTAVYPNAGNNMVYPILGLAGESGEVAEKMKKVLRDEDGKISETKKEEITKELGDVMWYLSQIATELGVELEEVAAKNLEKLFSRLERGKLSGSGDNR